tara:strand:+ start:283 stop:768 length:486 start_codon:yes stop_codon:yes gene_type:complete
MTRYLLVLLFSLTFLPIVSAENQGSWSFSIGQFDINDSNDSSEIRLERLSERNMFGDMKLKPFVGFMINGDDGKYLYSGLRKNYSISSKWIFTPSFAAGYYDRDSSKDLGHNIEFRSQIEFSRDIGNQNRIGFNLNHISNASIGDTNPGVESATISIIRPF